MIYCPLIAKFNVIAPSSTVISMLYYCSILLKLVDNRARFPWASMCNNMLDLIRH